MFIFREKRYELALEIVFRIPPPGVEIVFRFPLPIFSHDLSKRQNLPGVLTLLVFQLIRVVKCLRCL